MVGDGDNSSMVVKKIIFLWKVRMMVMVILHLSTISLKTGCLPTSGSTWSSPWEERFMCLGL